MKALVDTFNQEKALVGAFPSPGTSRTCVDSSNVDNFRSPRDTEAEAGGRAGRGEEEGSGLGAALGALRQLPPQLGRHLGHQHAPGPHGEGEHSSGSVSDALLFTF